MYVFEGNEAVIKMIIKGTKSHDETCVRGLTESLLISCLMGSTWIPKIQIKHFDTKNQLADILTKGSFSRNEWNHFLCSFNIMWFSTDSGSHLKSSFFQTRERLVIGAMSKQGQDTTSSDGSPTAKARPTNLVLQGHCKEGVSSPGSGSPVNPEN